MSRIMLAGGALAAFLAVTLGAFAAHGLRARLAPDLLAVFETGVRYQMYHALALLVAGVLAERRAQPALRVAGWSFACGMLLFSGSLYALSLSGVRALGAITPAGGVAFLIGWLALLHAVTHRTPAA
jgi:uncharacterized membrane protein YgdD (TMEM256/DUF423 family)